MMVFKIGAESVDVHKWWHGIPIGKNMLVT